MKLKYLIDGVEQTFWRRIYPTKTFKIVGAVVCGAALAAVEGKITWSVAFTTGWTGASIVLLRAAMTKLELAEAAKNPDLPHVTAEPKLK